MQTVQLVIFYLYLIFYTYIQIFNRMDRKVFRWKLNRTLASVAKRTSTSTTPTLFCSSHCGSCLVRESLGNVNLGKI